MEEDVKRLQQGIAEVEHVAEQLLLSRQQMVECDRARNGTREALTALRKQARTSKSSVPVPQNSGRIVMVSETETVNQKCLTCGEHDGSSQMWMIVPGADMFFRLPFHQAHCTLEKEQERLDHTMKCLQSEVKEQTLLISEKGGISDKIAPSLLKSLVTLKG